MISDKTYLKDNEPEPMPEHPKSSSYLRAARHLSRSPAKRQRMQNINTRVEVEPNQIKTISSNLSKLCEILDIKDD